MRSVQTGAFAILREGNAVAPSMVASISDVEVVDEINVPAMFSFTLDLSGPQGGDRLDVFRPGDQITIRLGLDKLQTLIVGEITAIEPDFGARATASIRGFDRMYRLRFGTDSRVFKNLSDNDIVTQVARAAGLTVKAQGIRTEIHDYVAQRAVSNYDFLLERCKLLNHELLMDGTTLVFRPSGEGANPVRTLTYPRDVEQVRLNLRVPTEGGKVTVRSFDPATNKVISATSQDQNARDRMGGSQTGYQMASDFPQSSVTIEQLSITSVEALQAVANARHQAGLERFIAGSANLVGDPDLTAGVNVRLSGLSKRFDGVYYITSSSHRYDDRHGYSTDVQLRRSGA